MSFGHNLSDEELDEMIEGVDKNKDGKINYLEFWKWPGGEFAR